MLLLKVVGMLLKYELNELAITSGSLIIMNILGRYEFIYIFVNLAPCLDAIAGEIKFVYIFIYLFCHPTKFGWHRFKTDEM